VGNDLLHGIVTLPVIMLMEHNAESNSIKRLFEERAPQHLVAEVVETVRSSGILERCYDIAEEYCNKAAENLQILPDSPSLKSLEALTRFVVERRH
jgi:hexaprenyl-diphosphate synthase